MSVSKCMSKVFRSVAPSITLNAKSHNVSHRANYSLRTENLLEVYRTYEGHQSYSGEYQFDAFKSYIDSFSV